MKSLFEKAKRLSIKLAKAIIEDNFSDPELLRWSGESEEGQATLRRFESPVLRKRCFDLYDDGGKESAVFRLKKTLRRRRQKQIALRLCGAAVVVLCLGSLLWLRPSSEVAKPSDATILPGTQQAVLVLGNGEQVELSKLTHLQETDGIAIARNQEGEIVYYAESAESKKQRADTNTLRVPRFGEYAIVLADGTRIKLNSESELRYPTVFSDTKREVSLKGEAYFEVAKSDRPFIVRTYGAQVRVYGTRFDVNSYETEKLRVVLVDGKVGVSTEDFEEVMLDPAQLALINAEKGITVKKEINPAYNIAWQKGYYAFDNERLEDILSVLARWYNFEVLYARPEIRDIHFTASLWKDQPLEHILKQFEKTQSISFQISGNQVIIH